MLRLDLSWGCDNNILLLKNFILHQTNLNYNQTKGNQTIPNQIEPGLFGPIFILKCIVTPNKSADLSSAIPKLPRPKLRVCVEQPELIWWAAWAYPVGSKWLLSLTQRSCFWVALSWVELSWVTLGFDNIKVIGPEEIRILVLGRRKRPPTEMGLT